jgi:hypothetical protein
VRVLLAALLIPCALASVLGVVVLYPFGADHRLPADQVGQRVNAEDVDEARRQLTAAS